MGQKSIILAVGLIIFTIILAGILVISRARGTSEKETPKDTETPVATEESNLVKTIDVVSDPMVYDGLNIEVESNVVDWVTKKSFTVSATAAQSGIFNSNNSNRSLLVIRSKDFKLPKDAPGKEIGLGEIENVHIKGQARIVDAKQLAELLGVHYNEEEGIIDDPNLKIDDGDIEEWYRGSVIIIDTVEKIPSE